MRLTWSAARIALLLPLAAAWPAVEAVARSETLVMDRSRQVVVAVPAAGDHDIARLQEDCATCAAARAAEHLEYARHRRALPAAITPEQALV